MRSEYRDVQIIRTALADAENKGKGEVTKLAMDSVRRMLAELFKDGLPVINHEEAESSGSGAIVDHTASAQLTAQPPTMLEVLDPDIIQWEFDDIIAPAFQ
jgi:hypothetical protein